MKVRVEKKIGHGTLWIETGELAKQAAGSCLIGYDETVVFCAVVSGPGRPGGDFFPLSCDYRERAAAAGKFPGGFVKREGRPTLKEVLTSRIIDRPMRPLFPKGYYAEVQVQSMVMACDRTIDPDVLGMIGSATCCCISPLPFMGPLASVRLALINGKFVPFPTVEQMEGSELDLIVSGNMDSVLMIEGFAREMPEEMMLTAINTAHEYIREICALQMELVAKKGVVKTAFEPLDTSRFFDELKEKYYDEFWAAKRTVGKAARFDACSSVKAKAKAFYLPTVSATPIVDGPVGTDDIHDDEIPVDDTAVRPAKSNWTSDLFEVTWHQLEERVVRDQILSGTRPDGRTMKEIRAIESRVNVLPRVHGSALFQRGETQVLITVTLGTGRDEQRVDGLFDEYTKKFMLDYNFPSYSVGECKPIRGPGRREYGHGALAERSIKPVIPDPEEFPYTIRVISDIMESNGSSSMASVCGTTLGLMAAGVPITNPVAGISIGLVKETADKWVLLTDIMGDEDHYGDMDFKVAGTQNGITGIQLDLKIDGIDSDIIAETLKRALEARREILRKMLLQSSMTRPADDISKYAPRILKTHIEPDKIGLLIGPGGKTIRAIQENTGASIDINNDGTVFVAATDERAAEQAMREVNRLTASVEVGRVYSGQVTSIQKFGAFIEVLPGRDGLCHVSEFSDEYVEDIHSLVKVGDVLDVKVVAIDDNNRIKLSRKAVLRAKS